MPGSDPRTRASDETRGTPREGVVIAIGGHEDREGPRAILAEVARHVVGGPLLVATLASSDGEASFRDYQRAFRGLAVEVRHLPVASRDECCDRSRIELVDRCGGIFFGGGDQLRITSLLGGTPVCDRVCAIPSRGGVVAGSSAGASVLTETMLVGGGKDEESAKVRGALRTAPGLGLVRGAVIDQHFAQRGRITRLLEVVAQNPRMLGLGLDEDTAIVVRGQSAEVIGSGSLYVVDGTSITLSNASEELPGHMMRLFDVRLHVLVEGDRYDLGRQRPTPATSGGAPIDRAATAEAR